MVLGGILNCHHLWAVKNISERNDVFLKSKDKLSIGAKKLTNKETDNQIKVIT